MLCLQLFVTHDTLGCLNLYASKVDAFTEDDRYTGLALAAHVAVAYTAARNEEHFDAAIHTRTVIGQAQGVLMERYQLSPGAAFAVMQRVSQQQNRKLRQIAIDLVHNGIDPARHSEN
ncbi:MAG: hypothetical protein JWP74_3848 [Marmoricola sp.]|nr:hypothetical protein [Marmoricola sp.]